MSADHGPDVQRLPTGRRNRASIHHCTCGAFRGVILRLDFRLIQCLEAGANRHLDSLPSAPVAAERKRRRDGGERVTHSDRDDAGKTGGMVAAVFLLLAAAARADGLPDAIGGQLPLGYVVLEGAHEQLTGGASDDCVVVLGRPGDDPGGPIGGDTAASARPLMLFRAQPQGAHTLVTDGPPSVKRADPRVSSRSSGAQSGTRSNAMSLGAQRVERRRSLIPITIDGREPLDREQGEPVTGRAVAALGQHAPAYGIGRGQICGGSGEGLLVGLGLTAQD